MRIAFVVPAKLHRPKLMRLLIKGLQKKYPNLTFLSRNLSQAEKQTVWYMTEAGVPVLVDHAPPKNWFQRIWRRIRKPGTWNPLKVADVVIVFWDGSEEVLQKVREARLFSAEIWYVRVDSGARI